MSESNGTVRQPLRVAVAGAGAIGWSVIEALDEGIPGCDLVAVSAKDKLKAGDRASGLRRPVPVLDIEALEPVSDVVVECAPANLLPTIAMPMLKAGKTVIVLSSGALLSRPDLIECARSTGGRLIVPSGALLGLDAMAAAKEGTIRSVRLITRKPVHGLLGAPYLHDRGIRIEDIREPMCVFERTAREAAAAFPANMNVAAALSLAGAGPDATRLEIWADPTLTRNTHLVEVDADAARFSMVIENVPSENPKTSRIAALSVIACLRKLNAPLSIGS